MGVVGKGTDIVIEGFPRSANTFAVVAFRMAQDRVMNIAHHVHGPAQVIQGVRLGVPVLLLLRDPVDAVGSLMVRFPYLPAQTGLRSYVAFHRPLVQLAGSIVIAPFELVTQRFSQVIRCVNQTYGTEFRLPALADVEPEVMFAEIDEMDRRQRRRGLDAASVARPVAAREEALETARELVRTVDDRECLEDAFWLFRRLHDPSTARNGVQGC